MSNVTHHPTLDHDTRRHLRLLISDARREKLGVALCPKGWGTVTGYCYGCRCPACKKASADAQRARRNRRSREEGAIRAAQLRQRRQERIPEIIRRRRAGEAYADIAAALRISKQTVGKVILELAPELIGAMSVREHGMADCEVCGRTFVRHTRNQRYCLRKCKDRARYVRKTEQQRRAA